MNFRANLLLYEAIRSSKWASKVENGSFAEIPDSRHCPLLLNEGVQRVRDSITDKDTYQQWLFSKQNTAYTYTDPEIETATKEFWLDNFRATMEEELRDFSMYMDILAQAAAKAAVKAAVKAAAEADKASVEVAGTVEDWDSEGYAMVNMDTSDTSFSVL
ncbi:hypothetical protein I302_108408 [Kwoniella bestiolae CBS 10118]|uniref:Uncharacterized protein n=1 Tax=Kwoniella bestiolae CBS 10118 TaxID=1296100 RepID=A0A1B9FVU6_9TREE|nr:hypothetical protein I302_07218 [Kwoniella bestiolae CBS 10118]OCF22871.1 hypothetical protein I302_07218 [Kwoniella bestiolae CBS 10118]